MITVSAAMTEKRQYDGQERKRFSREATSRFQRLVWDFFHSHGRRMPWRETEDPYAILVSEIMLQQTQVERVTMKYTQFLEVFPDFLSLAGADLRDVMRAWQGLGYNRRAIMLKHCAEAVVQKHCGSLPRDVGELCRLPGIGKATAGSLAAFAYNIPTVFIETNIRRVFIHHFFSDSLNITDTQILPLVEANLDRKNPRQWYWALMDYGSHLKKIVPNPNRTSAHYTRQKPFANSDRQIRGRMIALLLDRPDMDYGQIRSKLDCTHDRLDKILSQLLREGLLTETEGRYKIP